MGGPDFIVGPDAPKNKRNIFGVRDTLGVDVVQKVIEIRKRARELNAMISGSPLYPVCGLPRGISKPLTEEDRSRIKDLSADFVAFAEYTLKIFDDIFLKNNEYLDQIVSDVYCHRTYYMGLVDEQNRVNFYDGKVRIVDPEGKEFAKYSPSEYLVHVAEHSESWTNLKFPFLKRAGWKGLVDGKESGVYRADTS